VQNGRTLDVNRVLSIDLAHTTIRNMGVCLLEERQCQIGSLTFLKPSELGLVDPPDSASIGAAIFKFCSAERIHLLLLDGPQGWKDPANKLVHSRVCERILNTPAKTGTFGQVKPANYTQFVKFSTAVFANLIACGATLATNVIIKPVPDWLLVLESFPLSAWRKLKIAPLPAKSKATPTDCENKCCELVRHVGLDCKLRPSHDELQAFVAGIAGIAIVERKDDGYIAEGAPPFQHDGHWVEGLIVNPVVSS
jgi:hypothetical protein